MTEEKKAEYDLYYKAFKNKVNKLIWIADREEQVKLLMEINEWIDENKYRVLELHDYADRIGEQVKMINEANAKCFNTLKQMEDKERLTAKDIRDIAKGRDIREILKEKGWDEPKEEESN